MKKIMSARDYVLVIFSYVFVTCLIVSIVIPFWTVLMDSLSGTDVKSSLRMWPDNFTLSGYKTVLTGAYVLENYSNTIFRTLVGTLLSVSVNFVIAYPLSKAHLPFNRTFTILVLITMYFSGGIIPQYLLFKNIGLVNNRLVLILPMLFNGFYVLVMRNFIKGIPLELEESAKLDGANDIIISFQIYLPLLKPILATIALWTSVAFWNEWFTAMIYIQSPEKQIMMVKLRNMLMQANLAETMQDSSVLSSMQLTSESIKAVTIYVTILPILCIYPFLQKYFIKGLTSGAVKG